MGDRVELIVFGWRLNLDIIKFNLPLLDRLWLSLGSTVDHTKMIPDIVSDFISKRVNQLAWQTMLYAEFMGQVGSICVRIGSNRGELAVSKLYFDLHVDVFDRSLLLG